MNKAYPEQANEGLRPWYKYLRAQLSWGPKPLYGAPLHFFIQNFYKTKNKTLIFFKTLKKNVTFLALFLF